MEEADQKRCLGIGLILFRSHVVHITALTAVDCAVYLLGCCTGWKPRPGTAREGMNRRQDP